MVPDFPQFKPMTLDDRQAYEQLVADYPPMSDISFTTLHIWWNLEGKLAISVLNGNLVINYEQSFDSVNSGLSLIGQKDIDASIETIFEYLKQQGQSVRLVHVPEFVVKQLGQREKFKIEEELDYNEYILDSRALASLEHPSHGRTRRKVKRFLREAEERKVEIKPVELATPEDRQSLFDTIVSWEEGQASENDPDKTEHQALKRTLENAERLGMERIGLFIDERLCAILLCHKSLDGNYIIMNHLKVDYSIPYIFDYMTHHIANQAAQENVDYLNMEMDLGIENLRRHKMGLRPVDFFRKFTISPMV